MFGLQVMLRGVDRGDDIARVARRCCGECVAVREIHRLSQLATRKSLRALHAPQKGVRLHAGSDGILR